ncbi:MAG: PilZ domain-containing protein [Candidatus Sulfotelmatobacter sp.]
MNTTVDQRQHKRYQLVAPVSFSWETAERGVHQGHGFTRDFSISGAFVVTSNQLPIGSVLQMNFALPPLQAAGRGSRLKTSGRVVRSESDGFAVIADIGPGSRLHREQRARPAGVSIGTE